jgi:hypothetical protein
MPKVKEFYPSRASRREPPVESLWVERLGRTTGSNDHFNIKKTERRDTITLGILAHFRHFRHF